MEKSRIPHDLECARLRYRLASGQASEEEHRVIRKLLARIREAQTSNLDAKALESHLYEIDRLMRCVKASRKRTEERFIE